MHLLIFVIHSKDGCRVTEEVLHHEYRLSILWPETEIEAEAVRSCPCGALSSSIYNEFARRKCGGDYTNGGLWLDSITSSCQYNNENPNITFTLCHLTSVSCTNFNL